MLKQVGGTMGDKAFNGDIPNMQLGEYRYYPQDNSNLIMQSRNFITRKAFIRILKKHCPENIVDPNPNRPSDIKLKNYIGSVGIIETLEDGQSCYKPLVINKGYICFKEATAEEDGTILYLHGAVVMTFKERFIGTK